MRMHQHTFQGIRGALAFLPLMLTMSSMATIPDVSEYFPDVRDDLGKVIWSHATNSKALLEAALNDDTMMIEADILMGTKPGSDEAVPIMAHPPAIISDMTAEEFIENVIHANKQDGKKKGIKLDFKQYEAVQPVLQHLKQREDDLTFPVFLNADILQGPVNSTETPMPARQFIEECQKYLKEATLSVGWTTKFGRDDFKDSLISNPKTINDGQYTKDHVQDMVDLLQDWYGPVTFPVRASIAAQSRDMMAKLGGLQTGSTFTLWSPIDDPIDLLNLTRLIDDLGKHRTYIDLPFDLETGPEVVADPTYDGLHREGYSGSTGLVPSIFTTLIFALVFVYC